MAPFIAIWTLENSVLEVQRYSQQCTASISGGMELMEGTTVKKEMANRERLIEESERRKKRNRENEGEL